MIVGKCTHIHRGPFERSERGLICMACDHRMSEHDVRRAWEFEIAMHKGNPEPELSDELIG